MKNTNPRLLGFLALIVILAAGSYFISRKLAGDNNGQTRQAVFLTNGQVYFGYLENSSEQIATIRNVYYLQSDKRIQAGQKLDQISIVKLGKEVHKPFDVMHINRDHILFYEDMNDDSKINQAITDSQNQPEPAETIETQPTPTQ